ncbi:putative pentatricopeptide repeat-containing protein [Nymphaea thermarum]|nr:putative pentatricopeptide repeat-containing protein [Nymphaea thermarum]
MAFRVFLCCKSASKSLNQSFLQSPSSTFFPAFNSFFGVIRSFSSRSSNPWNHPQVHPLRSMMTSSHPRYDVAEAVSAALEPDSRVPATVTTGFLGSGKTFFIKAAVVAPVHVLNQIIDAYSKNWFVHEARRLFDEMPERNVFTWNNMINGYIINNDLFEARRLFELAPEKDTVSYNSVISGCTRNGCMEEAVDLFREMQASSIRMDDFTLTTMLNLAAKLSELSIIDMYSKCGNLDDAVKLFGEMSEKDLVSTNAMLAAYFRNGQLQQGYVLSGDAEKALEVFLDMAQSGVPQNGHTYGSILTLSTNLKNVRLAKSVHACVLRNGLVSNSFITRGLIDVYCKCSNLKHAEFVAHEIPHENAYSITSLIVGHANRGNLYEASRFFDLLPEKNNVAWTALITGHLRLQQSDIALSLFREFHKKEATKTDELILISGLGACALQAAFEHGKQIHSYIIRKQIQVNEKIGNALLDMYSKCGNIRYAEEIFRKVMNRDLVLYNSMIAGYANHGREMDAINLFEEMIQEGIKPDEISFIAIFSACRHAGLVVKGENFFNCMVTDHGITPGLDHYACMIDLFGRSNCMDKAEEMIKNIPQEPDAIVLGAFLNACRSNGKTKLAGAVEEKLLSLEADNGARYIQFANLYAAEGIWSEMGRIRGKMRDIAKVHYNLFFPFHYRFSFGGLSKMSVTNLVLKIAASTTSRPPFPELHFLSISNS